MRVRCYDFDEEKTIRGLLVTNYFLDRRKGGLIETCATLYSLVHSSPQYATIHENYLDLIFLVEIRGHWNCYQVISTIYWRGLVSIVQCLGSPIRMILSINRRTVGVRQSRNILSWYPGHFCLSIVDRSHFRTIRCFQRWNLA